MRFLLAKIPHITGINPMCDTRQRLEFYETTFHRNFMSGFAHAGNMSRVVFHRRQHEIQKNSTLKAVFQE